MLRGFSMPAMILAVAGCSDVAARLAGDQSPIGHAGSNEVEVQFVRTDADAYNAVVRHWTHLGAPTWTVDLSIRVTFTNWTGQPMVLNNACSVAPPPTALDKLVNGEWTVVVGYVMRSCWSPTIVAPGASADFDYSLRGNEPGGSNLPYWEAESIEGTYRLRWPKYNEIDKPASSGEYISNRFQVKVAPESAQP